MNTIICLHWTVKKNLTTKTGWQMVLFKGSSPQTENHCGGKRKKFYRRRSWRKSQKISMNAALKYSPQSRGTQLCNLAISKYSVWLQWTEDCFKSEPQSDSLHIKCLFMLQSVPTKMSCLVIICPLAVVTIAKKPLVSLIKIKTDYA